jgi:hypothetical protein
VGQFRGAPELNWPSRSIGEILQASGRGQPYRPYRCCRVFFRGGDPIHDPLFKAVLQEHLRDTIGIPHLHLDELYRFAERAVQAAVAMPPQSTVKTMRAWAEIRHNWCYMCGA